MNKRPLGIFDSGIGGLTVVKEIQNILPEENLIYLGDTARVPYGTRSRETIVRFALQDSEYLLNNHVKVLIIACNTVSSVALEEIKRQANVPVFDVVTYGIDEGIAQTKSKSIAVIGTNATINSHAYLKAFKRRDTSLKIIEKACPLLVPFIEEGELEGEGIEWITKKYLSEIINSDVDTLVLGCTHYPLIIPIFKALLPNITIVNPAKRMSESIKVYLDQHGLENNSQDYLNFSFTDLNEKTTDIAEKFLGKSIASLASKITPFT